MSKKLYIGNLSYETTEEEVRDMLAEFGELESLNMITDRDTGRFRGFCFAELDDAVALVAMNALNGKEVNGRSLTVNEARPRQERGGSRNNFSRGGGRRY